MRKRNINIVVKIANFSQNKTQNMWKFLLVVLLLNITLTKAHNADSCHLQSATENIKSRKFQLCFFEQLNTMLDNDVNEALNRLLNELATNPQYANHAPQIKMMSDGGKLEPKIVYLKQLLDMKLNEQWTQVDTLYTLRNLNFLSKFKRQFQQLQDESAQELRKLRWYNLCQQFWFRDELIRNETLLAAGASVTTTTMPKTKLAPLQAPSNNKDTETAKADDPLAAVDLKRFGRDLYEKVRVPGGEIIDDYLVTLHKLLQEVLEEKHETPVPLQAAASEATGTPQQAHESNTHVEHAAKLTKVLREIEEIIAIEDFYTKRQRLYAYLEHDLAVDYEQFKNSEYAREDMAVILSKLRQKGLDLFVTFIFSNFEFLEHLHEAWVELLPARNSGLQDDTTQQLYNISKFYVAFKRDWENSERYEAYLNAVKALYTQTQAEPGEWTHIFDLLNNASANVGSVTFNMIKAKCDEF